jgi:taurine dioxygenase
MTNTGFEIRPLDAPFGAEIVGVNTADDVGAATHATIRDALHAHRVLVFHGEPRPARSLVRFARRFGSLITLYEHETTVPGYPEIVRVSNVLEKGLPIGLAGEQEIPWHHDHPYLERPAKESFLEATELPPSPPRTSFVDMVAALEALPVTLRERLAGLHAIHHIDERSDSPDAGPHELGVSGTTPDYDDTTNVLAQQRIAAQRATHPVVVRHPESGLATLYVSPLATHRIVGLPDDEADTLLRELFDRALRPEHTYSHEWSAGDLVIWDTIATLHSRQAFPDAGRRLMRQMSTQCAAQLEPAAAVG